MSDICAPSSSDDALQLASLFASLGHLVVLPDYIGLKAFGNPSPELHPYLVGEATAIASLDAVIDRLDELPDHLTHLTKPSSTSLG